MDQFEIEEKKIIDILNSFYIAFENKDVDKILENHLYNSLLFDVIPPYKIIGKANIKKHYESCLFCLPDKFKIERRDESVNIYGDMAYVTLMQRINVLDEPNHKASSTWLRTTTVFIKLNDRWRVSHDHISIPYNPINNHAALISDIGDVSCGVNFYANNTCD